MMVYYIPVLVENFSKLLSDESISPGEIYKTRCFGSSHWESSGEDSGSIILLYNRLFIPNVINDEGERVSFFVVEIKTDKTFPFLQNGVYYSTQTIYLTPSNTRFIFSSEDDKKKAMALFSSFREVKLLNLYNETIVVEANIPTENISIRREAVKREDAPRKPETEQRLNAIKGMLYGYYLGGYLSSASQLNICRLNLLRDVNALFASFKTMPDGVKDIRKLDHMNCEKSFNSWRNLVLWSKEGADELSWGASLLKRIYETPISIASIEKTQSELKLHMERLERSRKHLSVDENAICVDENGKISLSDTLFEDPYDAKLLNAWLNELVRTQNYDGKSASEWAYCMTTKAKDVMGNEWEGSRQRNVLNAFRKHLGGESLNYDWSNTIISSLFAVLLKGEEWADLLRFMQSKEMCDYRFAFMLYGGLVGFSNLTNDFVDLIFENNDDNSVRTFYNMVHRCLHREELDWHCAIEKVQTVKNTHEQLKSNDDVKDTHRVKMPAETPELVTPEVSSKNEQVELLKNQFLKDFDKACKNDKVNKRSALLEDIKKLPQDFWGKFSQECYPSKFFNDFFELLKGRKGWGKKDNTKPFKALAKTLGVGVELKKVPDDELPGLDFGQNSFEDQLREKVVQTAKELDVTLNLQKSIEDALREDVKYIISKAYNESMVMRILKFFYKESYAHKAKKVWMFLSKMDKIRIWDKEKPCKNGNIVVEWVNPNDERDFHTCIEKLVEDVKKLENEK